jgi:hypothetical protein
MRKLMTCLLGGIVAALPIQGQQGLNNLWLLGYNSDDGLPWGNSNIEFMSGMPAISLHSYEIGFHKTAANITTDDGVLEFSTNGVFLADRHGDTLYNGTGLAPSNYTSQYPEGLYVGQGALILPKPDEPGSYLLIHGTVDNQSAYTAEHLYLTTVDMNINSGLGGVILKNEVLLNGVQQYGKITAVRHANGRDWWVFNHQANNNIFNRFLVTPAGVQFVGTQAIGVNRPPDGGSVCFSPDGTKFAYYWGETDLEIFEFDRCTGFFNDPVFIGIDDTNGDGGVAFSPNSRFVYVSSIYDIYQYDTEASDIAASMVHIAAWDGFYSPQPPAATLFDDEQLAPDGKIYISTGNGTFHLHVINAPDEAGGACDLVQHGVELPAYYSNGLPNHPNYHLGPVLGSVCDSLGMGVQELQAPLAPVQASPNPNNGRVTLTYGAQRTSGELQVLDTRGNILLSEKLPAWSTLHLLQLPGQPPGLYHCRLSWGSRSTSVRVILQP